MQEKFRYLKFLPVNIKYKLLALAEEELSEDEYWIFRYSIIEDRYLANICEKLAIGKTKYKEVKNIMLAKVDKIFRDLFEKKVGK